MKNSVVLFALLIMGILAFVFFSSRQPVFSNQNTDEVETAMDRTNNMETERATLGGGCFWCIEAVFERVEGVKSAISGYAGGNVKNPSYNEVCTGRTGHAEVVQIEFDPKQITFEELLDMFWKAHDPTTLNRQGADVGTQYRSIILYHNEEQKKAAINSKEKLEASGYYENPIVTEIEPLAEFYTAEDYHQDYYDKNPYAGYCSVVIRPKLKKLGFE